MTSSTSTSDWRYNWDPDSHLPCEAMAHISSGRGTSLREMVREGGKIYALRVFNIQSWYLCLTRGVLGLVGM